MSLQSLLARQAGIVSRQQAIRAGLTPDAVDRLLRLRRWRPVHPGVYLADGHRFGDEARVRAAVVWAGPGAVLSGAAAAWWHGLAPPPATVTLRVPRPLRPPPGIVAHDHVLAPADRAEQRGLAVTRPALTVLEAAVELGAAGDALLDEALRFGVGFPAVRAAHLRNLDAPGAARAARMLEAAADRSAATAEDVLAGLLRAAGIGGWLRGAEIAGERVAAAFPAARVAVDVTGWAWRAGEARPLPGWTRIGFSWPDLSTRPDTVRAAILHLATRMPGPSAGAPGPRSPVVRARATSAVRTRDPAVPLGSGEAGPVST